MNKKEKVTLFIAIVMTIGWILFLILWIFPQFKDSVTSGVSPIYGQTSNSLKGMLLSFSPIFVFLMSLALINFFWKDSK